MKFMHRRRLKRHVLRYLRTKHRAVLSGSDLQKTWKHARQTVTMAKVAEVLSEMSGLTGRCMYCNDSLGSEIEHYWPKSVHPSRCFRWSNMLLICGTCNRHKGQQDLIRDANGAPLLINPMFDAPWEYLFFDHSTGAITPRFLPDGTEDPRGIETLRLIKPLKFEQVLERRRRTVRALIGAATTFLSANGPNAITDLISAFSDHNDFGIIQWIVFYDGYGLQPFAGLRTTSALAWAGVEALAVA